MTPTWILNSLHLVFSLKKSTQKENNMFKKTKGEGIKLQRIQPLIFELYNYNAQTV